MTFNSQTELSDTETDAVLARHDTGVLALSRDDEPYAIPISYGYDSTDRCFYLRLVSTPESEKRRFLSSVPSARLVVYEEDGDEYRSVIATGTLSEVSQNDLTVEHIDQYGDAKRPLFEIWGESRPELDIHLYQFMPMEISGREIVVDRSGDAPTR